MTRRLFFLVGAPRSGTTLLQAMLNMHPAIVVAPETHFMRHFRHRINDPLVQTTEGFGRLLAFIAAQPEFADFGITLDDLRAAAPAPPRLFGALRALLEAHCLSVKAAATLVGEKTPMHTLFVRELATAFPDAAFVHLVRDPRAVAESLRRMPWNRRSLVGAAFRWRELVGNARRAMTGRTAAPGVAVRYEDVVAEPETQLRTICAALGVPFDPLMLQHAARPSGFDADREPWKAGVRSPVTPLRRDRWREELTRREQVIVEAAAGREMRRWGYEPSRPGALATPLFDAVHAARLIGRRWRPAAPGAADGRGGVSSG